MITFCTGKMIKRSLLQFRSDTLFYFPKLRVKSYAFCVNVVSALLLLLTLPVEMDKRMEKVAVSFILLMKVEKIPVDMYSFSLK